MQREVRAATGRTQSINDIVRKMMNSRSSEAKKIRILSILYKAYDI
jgi:hypothetical protein